MAARILVIDDNLTLLKAVRGGLEAAGYEVETSSRPLQMALDLGRVRPDLVLLDVEMPEVEGPEVLATLRENAAEIQAWVVLFSSLSEQELARRAEAVGAQGWIRKASPLNPGRLARRVRQLLLERKEAADRSAPPHALVIDDSSAMRRILRSILEDVAFEVLEARHGHEALERLGAVTVQPRLLLVDLNMPEMDGLEFIGQVRARFPASEARILMVTSETDRTRIQEALAAGADEYLMKPFSRASLLEKLATLELPLT